MRTTVDIDDDILNAAKDLAQAEGKTMGQVLSDLARRALTAPTGFAEVQARFAVDDWPMFPSRAGAAVGTELATSDLVRRLQDDLDLDDAVPFDFATGAARVFDSTPVPPVRTRGKKTRQG